MPAPKAKKSAPQRAARAGKRPRIAASKSAAAAVIDSAASSAGPIAAPSAGASTEYAGRWWPPYQLLSQSVKPSCEKRWLR